MKLLLKRALLTYTRLQHNTLDFLKCSPLEPDCRPTVRKRNQIQHLRMPEHLSWLITQVTEICNNKSPLRSNLKKFPAHWEKLLQKANVHFSSNFQLNSERGDTDAVVVLSKSVKDRTATAVTQLCERKETRHYQLLLPHEEAEKYLCEAKGEVIKKKQHKRR